MDVDKADVNARMVGAPAPMETVTIKGVVPD